MIPRIVLSVLFLSFLYGCKKEEVSKIKWPITDTVVNKFDFSIDNRTFSYREHYTRYRPNAESATFRSISYGAYDATVQGIFNEQSPGSSGFVSRISAYQNFGGVEVEVRFIVHGFVEKSKTFDSLTNDNSRFDLFDSSGNSYHNTDFTYPNRFSILHFAEKAGDSIVGTFDLKLIKSQLDTAQVILKGSFTLFSND